MEIKRYDNADTFLSHVGDFLHTQEIVNSIFIDTLKLQIQKEDIASCYCGAVWASSKHQFVFALFGLKNGYLYTSGLSIQEEERYGAVIDLLVQDVISFPFTALHGYQPALDILKNSIVKHQPQFKFRYTGDVYSYTIKQVQWSPQSLAIKSRNTATLKQATQADQALVVAWAQDYFNDLVFFTGLDIDTICLQEFEQTNICLLYVEDVPVSLTWKRRALKESVSAAYVYTPQEYRGKGYAEACVSMATELFLKDFQVVTLNSVASQDPSKNLYARLGYKLFGKAGRYVPDK